MNALVRTWKASLAKQDAIQEDCQGLMEQVMEDVASERETMDTLGNQETWLARFVNHSICLL